MPTFAYLLVVLCVVQNAYSQCLGDVGALGVAGPGLAAGLGAPYGYGAGCAGPAYGGTGAGNVAITGELPVGGLTTLAGQVPIIGAVQFGGPVCAAGTVSIAGSCACGCGAGPYGIY